jgi:hypothetical protein
MVCWRKNECKTVREMNHFDSLLHNVPDFFVNWMMKHNQFTEHNVKPFFHFIQISQTYIDNIYAADPNPQNFGFNFS